MRVALISDLHGNVVALAAVLEDLCRDPVDQVVCLGDVATLGPDPHGVLAALEDLGCVCIQGNHDAFLLDPELVHDYTEAPEVVASVAWCAEQLTAEEQAVLETFVPGHEVDLGAGRRLACFHGTPGSHTEDLLATTPAEVLDEHFRGLTADVLAGGHTHLQLLRQHGRQWLVNPGSVGLPFETYAHGGPPTVLPHADYAVVVQERGALHVELRRLPLDFEALRRAALGSANPLMPALMERYATPPPAP